MLRASFRFALSAALLPEHRGVLPRPKLLRLHRLIDAEIDTILTTLARRAIVLFVPPKLDAPAAPDAGDQFLWNLLTSREDLLLVTGDKLLLQSGPLQARVVSPQDFAAQIPG